MNRFAVMLVVFAIVYFGAHLSIAQDDPRVGLAIAATAILLATVVAYEHCRENDRS